MRTAIPLVVLLTLSACVENVGKGQVAATVQDVPESPEAAAPADAGTTALAVDPARSSLRALGAKITATHPIDFKRFDGEVQIVGDTVTGVSFTADMASLEADHPRLTSHLKNEDFFDVPNHPTSTFRSATITPGWSGEGSWTHTVAGDMTIRGKTRRLTFPANITVAAGEITADTTFVIDRRDFGVVYPGRPDDLVQDNVKMTIQLVAPRA